MAVNRHLVEDKHLKAGEVILLGTKLLCAHGQRLAIRANDCYVLPKVDEKAELVKLIDKK